MNYEKKYKEALETARKLNSGEGVAAPPDWTVCEVIFPELKESEDERIRKGIIHLVNMPYENGYFAFKKWEQEEMLAWLEKQGEQSSSIGKDLQVDGFDAELNALLKKYEHLSKKELQEPLEFYLGVVRDDLDIVREDEKPKWSEEDSLMIDSIIDTMKWLEGKGATNMKIDFLKSLKQRMEQ